MGHCPRDNWWCHRPGSGYRKRRCPRLGHSIPPARSRRGRCSLCGSSNGSSGPLQDVDHETKTEAWEQRTELQISPTGELTIGAGRVQVRASVPTGHRCANVRDSAAQVEEESILRPKLETDLGAPEVVRRIAEDGMLGRI